MKLVRMEAMETGGTEENHEKSDGIACLWNEV
jgi:hypothetical protein